MTKPKARGEYNVREITEITKAKRYFRATIDTVDRKQSNLSWRDTRHIAICMIKHNAPSALARFAYTTDEVRRPKRAAWFKSLQHDILTDLQTYNQREMFVMIVVSGTALRWSVIPIVEVAESRKTAETTNSEAQEAFNAPSTT